MLIIDNNIMQYVDYVVISTKSKDIQLHKINRKLSILEENTTLKE